MPEKTFAAAHPRRQQRHSRPVPGFQEIHFPAAPGAFRRAREIVRERTAQPGRSRKTGGDPQVVRVLFSRALHPRERAVRRRAGRPGANQILSARQSPVRMKLFAAGGFVINEEKAEFDQLLKNPEFNHTVNYLGFVSGAEKERALREADLFCFPPAISVKTSR